MIYIKNICHNSVEHSGHFQPEGQAFHPLCSINTLNNFSVVAFMFQEISLSQVSVLHLTLKTINPSSSFILFLLFVYILHHCFYCKIKLQLEYVETQTKKAKFKRNVEGL